MEQDGGGGVSPRIELLDRPDEDQEHPASGTSTPGPVIDITDDRVRPTGERSWSLSTQTEIYVGIFSPTHQLRIPVTIEEGRSSRRRRPVVRDNIIVAFALSYCILVTETAHEGTSLENAKEATRNFGPLKAVLGAIDAFYADREVGQQPPQDSPLTSAFQGSVTVRNKIEVLLSHINDLEERFGLPPGLLGKDGVAEQRRRDEILEYVISLSLNLDLSTSF